MITAEEFLKKNSRLRNILVVENTTNLMIEFAKLHCIEQAKVISEKVKMYNDNEDCHKTKQYPSYRKRCRT